MYDFWTRYKFARHDFMSECSDDDEFIPYEYLLPWPWRQQPVGPPGAHVHLHANLQHSFEQVLLEAGEKKVEMKLDTRKLAVRPLFSCHLTQCFHRYAQHLDIHL